MTGIVYRLDELLKGMGPKNRHPEISTGAPVGAEFGAEDWQKVVADFTRVCEQTGLIDKLRKEPEPR